MIKTFLKLLFLYRKGFRDIFRGLVTSRNIKLDICMFYIYSLLWHHTTHMAKSKSVEFF